MLGIALLSNAARANEIDFVSQVQPILKAHCFKCHGENKQKGDLRLDLLSLSVKDRRAVERWHDVRDAVNSGEMPPSDQPDLSQRDRQLLTGWITGQIEGAAGR